MIEVNSKTKDFVAGLNIDFATLGKLPTPVMLKELQRILTKLADDIRYELGLGVAVAIINPLTDIERERYLAILKQQNEVMYAAVVARLAEESGKA